MEPGADRRNALPFERTEDQPPNDLSYVRRDWRCGGALWQDLRRRYKRRKRHYGLERRGRLQGKPMIEERPECVEACQKSVTTRAISCTVLAGKRHA